MGLKAVVEDLETIPEAQRELYKEQDGKYVLDAEVDDHPAVRGLKSAHERVKEEERKARERLKQFGDVDPERVQQMLRDAEEREQERAKKAGEFDQLKSQLVEKHQAELKKATERGGVIERALHHALAESVAVQEIAKAKGSTKLLLPHVLKQIKIVEDESATEPAARFRAVVVDSKGNPRVGDAQGTPMTIAALIAEFRENQDFAGAFQGSGASGSGAAGSDRPAGPAGTVRTKADLKTDAQKAAYIGKHGRQAFIDLPEK